MKIRKPIDLDKIELIKQIKGYKPLRDAMAATIKEMICNTDKAIDECLRKYGKAYVFRYISPDDATLTHHVSPINVWHVFPHYEFVEKYEIKINEKGFAFLEIDRSEHP